MVVAADLAISMVAVADLVGVEATLVEDAVGCLVVVCSGGVLVPRCQSRPRL
jgi:hypothetical protein